MSSLVRIGVVGLGYWGPNLARTVADSPRSELRWLCDLDEAALRASGRRYPEAAITTDVETLLRAEDLDAVIVATPVSTHHEICSRALACGMHVFVEKPLAQSSADARDLIARAKAAGRVLLPGHTFLYSPAVLKIKELIDSGELGEIYFISMSRVNLGLHQRDASVLWDLAPHDLSILRYWLGELPTEVSALTRSCLFPQTPDVAFVNLRFPSGMIAHLELAWLSPSKLRRTAIVGSRKMVVYDDTSGEPVRVFDSGAVLPDPETFGEFQLSYRTGDVVSPKIDASEPLSLEIADFCAAILDESTPRSNGQIGLDVVTTIEAIERSLASSGAMTSLNEHLAIHDLERSNERLE